MKLLEFKKTKVRGIDARVFLAGIARWCERLAEVRKARQTENDSSAIDFGGIPEEIAMQIAECMDENDRVVYVTEFLDDERDASIHEMAAYTRDEFKFSIVYEE